jgi:biopolymer transport protein ExbD
MQFSDSTAARRMPSVLPLLGVSLLPALVVLAMACFSMSREEESIRLPAGTLPRPPAIRETPTISVRLSRQGAVTVAGQAIAEDDLAAAWQRERAALRLLGCEPSQATVAVRADRDVPTDKVQRLMEKAQDAGFTQCVLRPVEPLGVSSHKK